MPMNFKNPPKYTAVSDKPTRRTGYGTVANEVKEAGSNLTGALRAVNVMPHYGIKGITPKKSQ